MAITLTDIIVPTFVYDSANGKSSAKRIVKIANWSDVDTAVTELTGSSIAAGGFLITINPAPFPGKNHLVVHKVTVKGENAHHGDKDCVGAVDSDGAATSDKGAILMIEYATLQHSEEEVDDPPTDTLLTISRSMSLELVVEEESSMYWETGTDKRVEEDVKITAVIGLTDIRMVWHDVVNPPWAAIHAKQGLVNNAVFMGRPVEQVMFIGMQDQKQFQSDGTTQYDLTYQFSVRTPKFNNGSGTTVEGGWNHYPRSVDSRGASDPHFQRVYRSNTIADANLMFLKTDFSALFVPSGSLEA